MSKDEEEEKQKQSDNRNSSAPLAVPLKPSGNITVRHEDKPPQPPEVKRIHPRRPMPVVPEAQPKKSGTDDDK